MIVVNVYENTGRIARFSVQGHARYRRSGEDIVCAAVSALVANAVNSSEKLLGVALDTKEDDDMLSCAVPESGRARDIELLLRSMVFGIEQTAGAYPKHVKVLVHHE